jgi:hypothetical protein
VVLVFYGVSGGPFGVEPAVAAGVSDRVALGFCDGFVFELQLTGSCALQGPLIALLGFIVLPIAWSIPEALITAELSTAFPEASGFVAWVTTAYGPFWGFMVSVAQTCCNPCKPCSTKMCLYDRKDT